MAGERSRVTPRFLAYTAGKVEIETQKFGRTYLRGSSGLAAGMEVPIQPLGDTG